MGDPSSPRAKAQTGAPGHRHTCGHLYSWLVGAPCGSPDPNTPLKRGFPDRSTVSYFLLHTHKQELNSATEDPHTRECPGLVCAWPHLGAKSQITDPSTRTAHASVQLCCLSFGVGCLSVWVGDMQSHTKGAQARDPRTRPFHLKTGAALFSRRSQGHPRRRPRSFRRSL